MYFPYLIEKSYPHIILALIIIDLFLLYKLRKIPGYSKKESWITSLVIFAVSSEIFDVLSVTLAPDTSNTIRFLVNAIYYILYGTVILMLLLYCENSVEKLSRKKTLFMMIPHLIFIVLVLTSYWTGWFFSIDEAGQYVRGIYYVAIYACMAVYYFITIIGVSLVRLTKEQVDKKIQLLKCNIIYFITLAIGIIAQFIFLGIPFSSTGLAIMLILIFIDNYERLYTESIIHQAEVLKEKELIDYKAELFKKNAEFDGMTQLLNRSNGEKYVNEMLKEGRYGMFCMFDVDDFKRFNDTYGHVSGDEILCGIAKCMKTTFRASDLLIRLGGDEFAVYAPEIIDPEVAKNRIHALSKRVKNMKIDGIEEEIHISVGVTYCDPNRHHTFDQLFRDTDHLMYEEKQQKKSVTNIGRYDFVEIAKELPGGMLVYEANEQEKIRYVSPSLISLFDCRDDTEFLEYTNGTFKGLVHPDDIERVEKEINEQIQSGGEQMNDYVEYRIITKKRIEKTVLDYGHLVESAKYGKAYFVMIVEKK